MIDLLKLIFVTIILAIHQPILAQKPKVVSSASMIWDMVKNIGGDKVEHGLIVPIGGDPHLHEPTPRDARMVASADQIFVNGLTFEGWISELIANSGTKAHVDTVTSGIDAISSSVYENSYDPHAWMDAENGIIYADNILASLISLDPENTNYYQENHASYVQKLKELDAYIMNRIKEIPEAKRVLITSHDAFEYYGKKYGLRLEAIMGISTEAEAQTSDIVRISKTIKESGVPAVFIESTINPKLLQQIAEDNGVAIGGELFADSIGDEESEAHSYYDMLKHNTDIIVNALSQEIEFETVDESDGNKTLLLYGGIAATLILILFLIIKKMS